MQQLALQAEEANKMLTTAEVERELLATDRCDVCTAAARVIVTFLNGELMFCGHHAKERFNQFQSKMASFYDPDSFIQP